MFQVFKDYFCCDFFCLFCFGCKHPAGWIRAHYKSSLIINGGLFQKRCNVLSNSRRELAVLQYKTLHKIYATGTDTNVTRIFGSAFLFIQYCRSPEWSSALYLTKTPNPKRQSIITNTSLLRVNQITEWPVCLKAVDTIGNYSK